MRRILIAAIAASLVGAFLFPTAAIAKQPKVDLCHFNEDLGILVPVSVPEKAAAKHLANHPEDLEVGDGAPTILARAWSDIESNENLIAQLEDTDNSCTVSVGDIVRMGGYPQSFFVLPYGDFTIDEHTVTSVVTATSSRVDVDSAEGRLVFISEKSVEAYIEQDPPADDSRLVDFVTSTTSQKDELVVEPISPSIPGPVDNQFRLSLQDDPFINVQINI